MLHAQGGIQLKPEQYNASDAPPLAFADACAAEQPASPRTDAEQKGLVQTADQNTLCLLDACTGLSNRNVRASF